MYIVKKKEENVWSFKMSVLYYTPDPKNNYKRYIAGKGQRRPWNSIM